MPLLSFLSSALFAFSASLDALIAGISLGIRKITISFRQNLLVSLIALAGTALSLWLGQSLAALLPGDSAAGAAAPVSAEIFTLPASAAFASPAADASSLLTSADAASPAADLADLAGSLLLLLIGVFYLLKYMISLFQKYQPKAQTLSWNLRTLLPLALALSLNNVGIGLSAGIAGLNPLASSLLTFLFSFLLLFLGNRLGKARLFRNAERYGDLVSGILLIGLVLFDALFA